MPPFCPQCGVDNLPSARFCDQCGATLIPVSAQPAAPTQPAPAAIAPVAPVVPVAPPQPAAAAQPGAVSAGPSVCPQCGMAVIPGEAFCDSCGAPLMAPLTQSTPAPALRDASSVPQQPSYPPPVPVAPPQPSYTPQQPSYPPPQPAITPLSVPPVAAPARTSLAPAQLIVQATGAALPLPAQQEALLGRSDAVSSFYPDIDLTNHGALDGGVGRRHLRVFVQGGQLMAEDLDSVNGSALNGQKLMPRQPHQLKGGDVLTLGRVALQVRL